MAKKKARQTPTVSVVLPYKETKGQEAVDLYNASGNTAQEWQKLQLNNILATNKDGKWIHSRYGYSVPRRNGKGEVLIMRELYALMNGEKVLHTAHLADTSSDAADRLAECLDNMGYTEVIRVKKDEPYDKHYVYRKQYGLEEITVLREGGGTINFRTRTSRGGLGRGYDLLIVDEAQEYLDDQESSLKYVVSSSKNPQTIMTGTPPTAVSAGTKFPKYREQVLDGQVKRAGWAEWSVEKESDPHDEDLWYQCNPSLETVFSAESVEDEIGDDIVDFNIQRLGLWYKRDLKSAISEKEWNELYEEKPQFKEHRLFVGIKFGKNGENVVLSIAVKLADGSILVEVVNSRPIKDGVGWLLDWLCQAKSVVNVAVDGLNGQAILIKAMQQERLRKPITPTGQEFYTANTLFEQAIASKTIHHTGQEQLSEVVSHCEKTFSAKGGFSYKALTEDLDIALMDSVILAHWLCVNDKGEVKQRVRD